MTIADQLEDPKLTKKLVKRGITELVTPGVSINDNVLNYRENNFLAAVHFGKGACGVAFLDISTGEFLTAEGPFDYVDKLLNNFAPKFDFLHHFGGQGLVVRGQHGHFAQRALSIVSGGLVSVAAAGRGISGSSRGILREHGAVCLAEVGQYAVEVTSCVEAVVHTFCFGDGQMGCSAFGAYGNKILSRAFAVGEV